MFQLVLFAGPMATMLNIPEATLPVFLAVYLLAAVIIATVTPPSLRGGPVQAPART